MIAFSLRSFGRPSRPVALLLLATALASAALLLILPVMAWAADGPPRPHFDGQVPMRDGTGLWTLVHLPDGPGPHPAILVRTPYSLPTAPPGGLGGEGGDPAAIMAAWRPVLDRGYAVVMQAIRGRQTSGGIDRMFAGERADGADAVAWIAAQGWSDGRVGIAGDSADGFSGLLAAAARPPALRSGFFQATCGDVLTHGVVRRTGGLQIETLVPWLLMQADDAGPDQAALTGSAAERAAAVGAGKGLARHLLSGRAEPADWTPRPLAAHPLLSRVQPGWGALVSEAGYAARRAELDAAADVAVPVLHVGLWQDTFADCTLETFRRIHARHGNQKLIMFQGTHYDIDEPALWGASPMLDWFDQTVRGIDRGVRAWPVVRFDLPGAAGGPAETRTATAWPPAGTTTLVRHLGPDGRLAADPPRTPATLGSWTVRPAAPVPTAGGRNLVVPAGTLDQAPLAGRADVLVFRDDALTAPLVLAGPVSLTVELAATAPDADLVVRLVEANADGVLRLVAENLARARYREGREAPSPLVPGNPVVLTVEVGQVADRLSAGSRLEVHLSGSNAPRWDVNPHRAGDPALADGADPVATTLMTGPLTPARLRVTVLPDRR